MGQRLRREVSISQRHLKRRVAQEFLHRSKRNARHGKMRCERVSEGMPAEIAGRGHLCTLSDSSEVSTRGVHFPRALIAVGEDISRPARQFRELPEQRRAERNDPEAAALWNREHMLGEVVAHVDLASLEIDVFVVERQDLGTPQSCVESDQDREPPRSPDGSFEYAAAFLAGQEARRGQGNLAEQADSRGSFQAAPFFGCLETLAQDREVVVDRFRVEPGLGLEALVLLDREACDLVETKRAKEGEKMDAQPAFLGSDLRWLVVRFDVDLKPLGSELAESRWRKHSGSVCLVPEELLADLRLEGKRALPGVLRAPKTLTQTVYSNVDTPSVTELADGHGLVLRLPRRSSVCVGR